MKGNAYLIQLCQLSSAMASDDGESEEARDHFQSLTTDLEPYMLVIAHC